MPLADTAQICLMVAPPLASGYTQKYGLKRQTAYPGEPGRIVNGKCDRPPRRNKSHSLRQKEAAKFASVSTELQTTIASLVSLDVGRKQRLKGDYGDCMRMLLEILAD